MVNRKIKVWAFATCFNRKEKTVNAINTLVKGNPSIDFEFIIADDNSKDGTAEAISKLPGVEVLMGDGNSFYTGGMRIAMGRALERLTEDNKNAVKEDASSGNVNQENVRPDFVLLFNDDVDFYDGAIEGLVERALEGARGDASRVQEGVNSGDAETTEYVGSGNAEVSLADTKSIWIGPTCELDRTTLSYGGIKRTSNWKPKFKIIMGESQGDDGANGIDSEGATENVAKLRGVKVDTFNANCVLIPTGIFEKTGNMDPVYHHSLGDFDYGYMCGRSGAEIYVSDEFVGICPNNSEKGTWRDASMTRRDRFKAKESIKGVPFGEFYHYILKNYNFPAAVIFSISPYIRILLGI